MGNENILQIIKFLTESLSDSISELVLIAIVHQEKNTKVPPTMPSAINIVIEAANNFVQVSFQIATQGFQSFPTMKERIVQAATEVANANKLLASVPFNSPDTALVWTSLVGGCKALGSSSVHLLECVYNSQIERILECHRLAEEEIAKIDFADIPEKAQNFITAVETTNQLTLNLATFVKSHGEAQESPLMKEKLLNSATKLISITNGNSDTLIDVVNEFLGKYTDPEKKQKLQNLIDDIKEELKKVKASVQEASQILSTDVAVLTSIGTAEDDSDLKQIVEAGIKYSNLRKELVEASRSGDMKRVQELRELLAEQRQVVFEKTENQADNIRRRRLLGYADEMEKLVEAQVEVAAHLLADPENPEIIEQLEEIEETMQEYSDMMVGPSAELAEEIDEELELLEELPDIAASGDKTKVIQAAKKLQKGKAKIANKIRQSASKVKDPEKKKRAEECAERLETLIGEEISTAQEILAHPEDLDLRIKLQLISDEIVEVLEEVDPLSTAGKARELLDDVQGLKTSSDKKAVGKKLKKTAAKLGKQVKAEAKYGAVGTRKKIESAVEELETLVDSHIEVCAQLEEDPASEELLEKVEDLEEQISEVLSEIAGPASLARETTDLLEEIVSMATQGDQTSLHDSLKRIGKTKAKIVSKARTEARNTKDPQRKKQLEQALEQLEVLIPSAGSISIQLVENSKDELLLEQLEETIETISEQLTVISAPDAILIHFENSIENEIEELQTASSSGQVQTTQKLGKKLGKTSKKFANVCRSKAEMIQVPEEKRKALQSIEKVENLASKLTQAAETLSSQPNQVVAIQNFEDLADEMLESVKILSESESVTLARLELDLVKELDLAVNANTAFSKTSKLLEINRNLVHVLKFEARNSPSQQREETFSHAAQVLSQIIPQSCTLSQANLSPDTLKLIENNNDHSLLLLEALSGDQNNIPSLARLYENDFSKLKNLAKKGDISGTKVFERKLHKTIVKLGKKSKEAASKIPNKIRAREVETAGQELETIASEVSKVATSLAADPSNKQLLERLSILQHQSKDCISQLAEAPTLPSLIQSYETTINQLPSFVESRDLVHVEVAAKRIDTNTQKIAHRVQHEIELLESPEEKQTMQSNLEKFSQLNLQYRQTVQKIKNNSTPEGVQELSTISEQLRELTRQFTDQEDTETTAEGLLTTASALPQTTTAQERDSLTKELSTKFSQLAAISREEAKRHPIRKMEIEETLTDISKDLEKMKSQSSQQPALKQRLDKLLQPLGVVLMNQYKQNLELVSTAAQGGDPKNIANAVLKSLEFTKGLSLSSLDDQKTLTPEQKQKVSHRLDDIKVVTFVILYNSIVGKKTENIVLIERASQNANDIIYQLRPSLEQQLESLIITQTELLQRAKSTPQTFKTFSKAAKKIGSKARAASSVHQSGKDNQLPETIEKLFDKIHKWESAAQEQDQMYQQDIQVLLSLIEQQTVCKPVATACLAQHLLNQVQSNLTQAHWPALKEDSITLAETLQAFAQQAKTYLPQNERDSVLLELEQLTRNFVSGVVDVLTNPSNKTSPLQQTIFRLREVIDEVHHDMKPTQLDRQKRAALKTKRSFSSFPSPTKDSSWTASMRSTRRTLRSSAKQSAQEIISQIVVPQGLETKISKAKEALNGTNAAAAQSAVVDVCVELFFLEMQHSIKQALEKLDTAETIAKSNKLQEFAKPINELNPLHQNIINGVNNIGSISASSQKLIFEASQQLINGSNQIIGSAQKVLNRTPEAQNEFSQTIKAVRPAYESLLEKMGYKTTVDITKSQESIIQARDECIKGVNTPIQSGQAISTSLEKVLLHFTPPTPTQNQDPTPAVKQESSTPTPKAENDKETSQTPTVQLQGPDVPSLLKVLRTQPASPVSPPETITEPQIHAALEDLLKPKVVEKKTPNNPTPAKSKKGPKDQRRIKEGTTFEENLSHIADFVREEAQAQTNSSQQGSLPDPKTIPEFCEHIAAKLSLVGSNANNRQLLIQTGKELCTISIGLDKVVKSTAATISNKQLQDILIRSSEALRNYATQLKILAAVVAASTDSSSDHRFIQMARNFAYSISQLLTAHSELELRQRL